MIHPRPDIVNAVRENAVLWVCVIKDTLREGRSVYLEAAKVAEEEAEGVAGGEGAAEDGVLGMAFKGETVVEDGREERVEEERNVFREPGHALGGGGEVEEGLGVCGGAINEGGGDDAGFSWGRGGVVADDAGEVAGDEGIWVCADEGSAFLEDGEDGAVVRKLGKSTLAEWDSEEGRGRGDGAHGRGEFDAEGKLEVSPLYPGEEDGAE